MPGRRWQDEDRPLDEWIRLLQTSPDGETRWLAVEALIALAPAERSVPLFRAALDDPDPRARGAALHELFDLACEEDGRSSVVPAIPDLIRILDHPDPSFAAEAARTLGVLGPLAGSAVAALEAATRSRSSDLRIDAAEALESILGEERVPDDGRPTTLYRLVRKICPSSIGISDDPWQGLLRAYLVHEAPDGRGGPILEALRDAGSIDPEALANADHAELIVLTRSPGKNLKDSKVAVLRRLAAYVAKLGTEALDSLPTESLRDGLRSIRGIGPALADYLVLRGLFRPAYPVDRASYRIAVRHGWLDPEAGYDEAHAVLTDLAPDDPVALATIANGFASIGRQHCKPAAPRCDGCELRPLLPESGPVRADVDADD